MKNIITLMCSIISTLHDTTYLHDVAEVRGSLNLLFGFLNHVMQCGGHLMIFFSICLRGVQVDISDTWNGNHEMVIICNGNNSTESSIRDKL